MPVCLLLAGQPKSAGDAAKSGQLIGQFSWVTGDPIGLKGLFVEVETDYDDVVIDRSWNTRRRFMIF